MMILYIAFILQNIWPGRVVVSSRRLYVLQRASFLSWFKAVFADAGAAAVAATSSL